jgi:uncharacterized protein
LGGDGSNGWLVRGGELRAVWRLVLFAVLFLALLQLGFFAAVGTFGMPDVEEHMARVLLIQSVMLLGAALVAGWVMLRWIDRRPAGELGFALERRVPRDLAAGLAIGAVALVAIVLVLALFGAFRFTHAPGSVPEWAGVMATALLFLALPAAAEEALFRGYPFRTLVRGIGPVGATLIMSALFALVHGANPHVGAFGYFNIFAAGVMLSLAMLWTGSLWFATALHLGWNWAMAALLDLPVSGLDLFDAPLYDGAPVGPDWLTGGVFGPEGGLAGSLAVVVGIILTWWYKHVQDR